MQLSEFVARYPVRILECGCWQWIGGTAGNYKGGLKYGRLRWQGRSQYAHRVTYELRHGPLPDGAILTRLINRCEFDTCCNPDHWQRTRRSAVPKLLAREGRIASGAGHSAAVTAARRRVAPKLTIEKAREIRASADPIATIAARYGIDDSMVYAVRAGRSWREPSPFAGLGAA